MSSSKEGVPAWMSRVMILAGPVLGISILLTFAWILLPGGLRQPEPHLDRDEDPTEFAAQEGRQSEPIDLAAAYEASEGNLARGKELYAQVCVSCHGDTGRGDGPAGKSLQPPARNFTIAAGWKNGTRVGQIYRTLSEGISGGSMVAYDYMPPSDRFALAHYVRSLVPYDPGTDSPAEVAALDEEYLLSTGSQQAHRVPVSRIIDKMSEEYERVPALAMPAEEDASPAAALVRRSVRDPGRAAITVHGLRGLSGKPQIFAGAVIAGAPANGFSPGVGTLTPREWEILHQALYAGAPRGDM